MNKSRYGISVFLLAASVLGLTFAAATTSFSRDYTFEDCPVTRPPETPFVPPDRFPSRPPGTHFWYGGEALWTALPENSTWSRLPRDEHGYGNKLPYWSVDFDLAREQYPALHVLARRLDGPAPNDEGDRATNGFSPDSGLFMLTGLNLAAACCWEISASYRDASLVFVIWMAP